MRPIAVVRALADGTRRGRRQKTSTNGADGNAERKLPERRLGEVRVEREKVAESVERREEPVRWVATVRAERRTRGVRIGEARGVGKSRLETGEESGVRITGGLGERLGYKGIKVRLPVERATMETYLGLYVKSILAIQETKEVVRKSGVKIDIPLAIMTSEDTHDMTDLLESNNYFGAKKTQITLMKQEKVPCLVDNDAHLATKDDDKYVLQTKPHGHGGDASSCCTNGFVESDGRAWA